jgi:hypothetical protein
MAKGATKKADYSHSLVRGQEMDTSQYGPMSSGSDAQPFWDDPLFDSLTNEPLGIVGELYSRNTWDRVALNGYGLPGIWSATATPAIQVDVQKPNGFDGAALVSRGYIPAGITITGKIWTPAQWKLFQQILPTFWARPNHIAVNDWKKAKGQVQGKQRSVTVDYPGLAAFNIHCLVIKQITPPEETSEQGVRQITIIAVEYVPEPKQLKQSAVKTADGTGKDRSVQADKILGRGGASDGVANARKPPSQTQAHKT